MNIRFLIIVIIASASIGVDQAYALCAEETNYDYAFKESELVFTGTVTRLDNYDGPQKVTFFIHEVIKGEINTPKYILENSGKIFYEDGSSERSSVSVDYKIGKTYKVYVMNGETSQCTTKITIPPTDYMWEPGPEDGNYYSENPVWIDPCTKGYGLSDGVCITLEEMNKYSPICGANPKHDFGKCKRIYEEPDNTLDYVLAYCNATGPVNDDERRWWNVTHYIDNIDCEFLDKVRGSSTYGQPIENSFDKLDKETQPHPEPESIIDERCGVDTVSIDGVCQLDTLEGPDDVPFFGIFVYIDNLFSWIMGK